MEDSFHHIDKSGTNWFRFLAICPRKTYLIGNASAGFLFSIGLPAAPFLLNSFLI